MRIKINPLSVNECWQGKRYKTQKYKAYEKELLLLLPNKFKDDFSELYIKVGVTALKDIDNVLKPLLDILQKKYGFNDRYIYKLTIEKEVVKKGSEYIEIC